MSNFQKMGVMIAQKNKLDSDQRLAELKNQKDSLLQAFNLQIAEEELQKNEIQQTEQTLKFQDKQDKLRTDFITQFFQNQQSGPVAVGGNLLEQFAPEQVEPDAQGLPILSGKA